MKILLSAYACHPNKGSEPGIGWNWLKEISKYHEIWAFIYAEQGQRDAVHEEIQKLPHKSNIHIVPISVPAYFQNHLYRVRYEIWQWRAYKIAQKLLQEKDIDLIHHVTIAAWWNCGYLWKLRKPFIFGPMSGAQRVPVAGYQFLQIIDIIHENTRNLIFYFLWKFWLRFHKTIKNSKIIFCSNEETYIKVKKKQSEINLVLMSDVGVVKQIDNIANENKNQNQLNMLWVGLLIPRKNFGLILKAVGKLPDEIPWSLKVVGDGQLLEYWKAKVFDAKLDKRISFLGSVDYQEMQNYYNEADIFLFPSLREATGTVLLEAMSHEVPVVALKINGAKIVLDDNCAILIKAENKEQMINDFTNAIIRLAKDPELRQKLGAAGRKRVEEHFLWEKRGEVMNEYYQRIMEENSKTS